VRPDHCKLTLTTTIISADTSLPFEDVAKVAPLDEVDSIRQFFEGFLIPVDHR
jgi:hypothetical protein